MTWTRIALASRKEQKQERRREREAAERVARAAERRRRRMTVGLVAAAALAVLTVVVLFGIAGISGSDDRDAFDANAEGLEERMADAKLPLASDHFHPTLKVFVSGKEVPVPDEIGVGEGGVSAPLHRHPGDPQLHAEGVKEGALTLDQVMKVWGVPLSSTQLGPHETQGQRAVRMWVKPAGASRFRESREFGNLRLRDRVEIYLTFGTPEQTPIAQ